MTLALIETYAKAAPVARWLGFSAAADGEDIIFTLGFAERHIGNAQIRALHGGVIAAFLEFSAQAALHARLGGESPILTVNGDVDYLSSGRAEDMKARVRFARIGRRLAFAEAVGWQKDEGRPVAAARFRFRIRDTEK